MTTAEKMLAATGLFGNQRPLGRLLRLPLKAIPETAVLPVLSGPNRGRRWIAGSLAHGCWLGWYERDVAARLLALVHPGMTILDVGANVGYYTLALSRAVGSDGRVIAIEPEPRNIALLRKHALLNRIANVQVVEAAASERAGTGFLCGRGSMATLSHAGVSIKTVRLDDLVMPDVIKMDIEGAETAALRGASTILAARRAQWIIALHADAYHEVPRFLHHLDYVVEWIDSATIYARPHP